MSLVRTSGVPFVHVKEPSLGRNSISNSVQPFLTSRIQLCYFHLRLLRFCVSLSNLFPSLSFSILTYISSSIRASVFVPRLLWSILCPMILYITPEQQSKHRAQSQASWASSKNRVRPDTNIYPSPSKCPPAYLIVPPLLSYVPQNLVAQIMMYAFSLPMIYSDFCRLCRRPPPSFCSINVGWF